jgi:UDP-N-acetylglucosamine enolpyruvyl transferase
MSQALASARKRRGVPQNTPDLSPQPRNNIQQPNVNTSGLTLPQVITIVDKRLTNLEQFMKEVKETGVTRSNNNDSVDILQNEQEQTNWIEEFNHRFEVLAEELNNIKDVVLKLQSYTMEVNKTLLEERINVFSDLGNLNNNANENITFDNVNNDLTSVNLRNLVQQEFETCDDL